jgi:hypothetical protein
MSAPKTRLYDLKYRHAVHGHPLPAFFWYIDRLLFEVLWLAALRHNMLVHAV